jgi:hypothetical protein
MYMAYMGVNTKTWEILKENRHLGTVAKMGG